MQLTLRQGQEHLTGRGVREPGREQRETALVATDDAELLARQPGQPVPREGAGLQQVNKPIRARARGDLRANTPDEIGSQPTGSACHASTLLPVIPGDATVRPAGSRPRHAGGWVLGAPYRGWQPATRSGREQPWADLPPPGPAGAGLGRRSGICQGRLNRRPLSSARPAGVSAMPAPGY